jgi:hypothetical protein
MSNTDDPDAAGKAIEDRAKARFEENRARNEKVEAARNDKIYSDIYRDARYYADKTKEAQDKNESMKKNLEKRNAK